MTIYNYHGNSFTLAARPATSASDCKDFEIGIAIRSGPDQYSRKIGRNIAQGRLMCIRPGIKGKLTLTLETPFVGKSFNWPELLDRLTEAHTPVEYSRFFYKISSYAHAELSEFLANKPAEVEDSRLAS